MPTPQPISSLTIHLTPEHLGFLAHLYPNEDPEDALIKLLDRVRSQTICRAEQQLQRFSYRWGTATTLKKLDQ